MLIEPWQDHRALRRASDRLEQAGGANIRAGRADGDHWLAVARDLVDGAFDQRLLARRRIDKAALLLKIAGQFRMAISRKLSVIRQ